MPPLHRLGLSFRPEYGVFTLRDVDADARVGAEEAIRQSVRNVVAAAEYEVYVTVAQLDLPVRADVEVWDSAPAALPAQEGWIAAGRVRLPFRSGHAVMGDGSGQHVDGPRLPRGPGLYDGDVWHRGRELAVQRTREIDAATTDLNVFQKVRYQEEHGSDIEQYVLRLWWAAPLPPSEDDEL